MFPDHGKILEVIYGSHCVRGFHSVIRESIFATNGHYRSRYTFPHTVKDIVNKMNAPISHQSSGIVPIPSECAMEPVSIERTFWCGSEPHIIIDAVRNGCVGHLGNSSFPVYIRPCFAGTDPAKFPRSQIIHCINKMRLTSLPLANLHNFPMLFNSFLHNINSVSYTHLRAHETVLDIVCRLLLEKKKT